MIVFDLKCAAGHRFEGWFRSSADYAVQVERGLLACPTCGAEDVGKAPMAPAVPAKGERPSPPAAGNDTNEIPAMHAAASNASIPPALAARLKQAMAKLAEVQAKTIRESRWVGKDFAKVSRAIHHGDAPDEIVHGKATREETESLLDEGVAIAPLLIPFAPPDEVN